MAVKARLKGDAIDLDALARLFSRGTDPEIGQDSDGYFLTSPELDGLFGNGGQLNAVASALLRRANGIARASDPDFRPAKLVGRFSNGDREHVIASPEVAEIRMVATVTAEVTGGPPAPPSPSTPYDQVAKNHPDVTEALDILGKDLDHLSWDDLHKVFEIIRQNVGGPNKGVAQQVLIGKNWLSQTEIIAFQNSANTKAISGDAARHARGQAKTSDSMTIQEGRAAISTLMRCWLDSLV